MAHSFVSTSNLLQCITTSRESLFDALPFHDLTLPSYLSAARARRQMRANLHDSDTIFPSVVEGLSSLRRKRARRL